MSPGTQLGLKRSVRGELIFGAVILVITSMLVNTSPPQARRTRRSLRVGREGGAVTFDTFFGPPTEGGAKAGERHALHVTVLIAGGLERSRRGPSVAVDAIARNPGDADRSRGRCMDTSAGGRPRPFAGDWTLEIHALLSEVDPKRRHTVVVPVG